MAVSAAAAFRAPAPRPFYRFALPATAAAATAAIAMPRARTTPPPDNAISPRRFLTDATSIRPPRTKPKNPFAPVACRASTDRAASLTTIFFFNPLRVFI